MTGKRIVLVFGLVAALGWVALLATAVAQDRPADDPAAAVGDDDAGRLPPGYSAIVKKSQRKTIYAIQETYQKQILVLEQQILALEQKHRRLLVLGSCVGLGRGADFIGEQPRC